MRNAAVSVPITIYLCEFIHNPYKIFKIGKRKRKWLLKLMKNAMSCRKAFKKNKNEQKLNIIFIWF